jgi:hypothetical protein
MFIASPTVAPSDSIESAQRTDTGDARFRIPACVADAAWEAFVAEEQAGGSLAELRAFLDAQLESGDLVLDFAPGFGELALGAATAPGGVATVMVDASDEARLLAWQDAAADAGAWVEPLPEAGWGAMDALLAARLEVDGRLFVHCDATALPTAANGLAEAIATGRLLALLVSGRCPGDEQRSAELAGRLDDAGLIGCQLRERDGEVLLLPGLDPASDSCIAVPCSLLAPDDEGGAGAPPAPSAPPPAISAPAISASAISAPAISAPVISAAAARPTWQPLTDGLSLVAPHSRTGYGVTGAHLLRALQARGVPVAFFPMGPVDASLTDNPALRDALDAQARFDADAPSVRLSQQFDLALHAGRGPRVGFPIFESVRFTARELHHLRQQDALLVCTPWAREVCHANGLGDVPVHVVPLGVDRDVFHEHVTPARRWDETVFLQVGKLEPRKGQHELLRAFEAAFTTADAVRLVLACHNPFQSRDAFEAALVPFRTSPLARRITLMPTELATSRDVAALMASADCGVFPARAEGWNLEALEMLSMGKRVIATHTTGHTAYLTAANATLLALGAPEPATAGQMLGTWGSWGNAQHEQLVEALRATHVARQQGPLPVNAAGIATASAHSWAASADALLAALGRLHP